MYFKKGFAGAPRTFCNSIFDYPALIPLIRIRIRLNCKRLIMHAINSYFN